VGDDGHDRSDLRRACRGCNLRTSAQVFEHGESERRALLKSPLIVCCAALLVGGGPVVGAATARSNAQLTLRIFDPKGRVPAQVSLAGVVRSNTRAIQLPGDSAGSGRLSLAFTKFGRTSFCSLTRGLAHVGARLHRVQSDALEIEGRVYGRGYIEYRIFPDGLCVSGSAPNILFSMRMATARRLARLLSR
jgi:hypothetical protein